MFSGDIELSPRWSVGASSGYDFKNNGFSTNKFIPAFANFIAYEM